MCRRTDVLHCVPRHGLNVAVMGVARTSACACHLIGRARPPAQVGKQLKLAPRQCLPMVVPFERFGNTSSSSTWWAPAAPEV